MAFKLEPTIVKGDNRLPFPSPILSCRIHDSWDSLKMKVPRREGNHFAGLSRDGVTISIQGQIGSVNGELQLSEEEMLETAEALRSMLNSVDDDGFNLILFRDDGRAERYFSNCIPVQLDFDFSSRAIFSYSAVIEASSPNLLG